jgi:hypothetical protein
MAVTKKAIVAGRQWLTPLILATQEAEIRRIPGSKPGRAKNPSQKRVGGVAQGEDPEFKPQH